MERIRILFTMIASIILSVVFISYMDIDSVDAQSNTSTDPKQLLRDFETAKDTIQNKIQINFDQLINEIEAQLDFNTIVTSSCSSKRNHNNRIIS